MQHQTPVFLPADELPFERLVQAWNDAYEGYFVPLRFTEDMLRRHMARAGADLQRSRVLEVDGAPAGVSLAACRADRGYIAGFGIAAPRRRQGLARALIDEQLRVLRAAGIAQVQLEVIEQNPARQLYAGAGFAEQRLLLVLDGSLPEVGAAEGIALDAAALRSAHQRLNAAARPTWRREWATVHDALQLPDVQAVGVVDGAGAQAYAVLQVAAGKLALLDAAAADQAAATRLLDVLARRHPGAAWRLVDEPEDTPLARAAAAAGASSLLRQVEMQLQL